MKPEVLFLAHRIPYPPDKGDKIRSWRLLQHLTQRFRVHLACFVDDPRDAVHQAFLESICESAAFIPLSPRMAKLKSLGGLLTGKPLSFAYYHDARMKQAVNAARVNPLAAEIAFSSTMAPYIEEPKSGRKRIIDFCDSDAEKWREYSREASGPLAYTYSREAKKLATAETAIVNWADASFAVTADEAAIFNDRASARAMVDWYLNGVDADYFNPSQAQPSANFSSDCVFVGAMDYRANVEGVLNFVEYAWPLVRKSSPEARFAIVGANPAAKIAQLNEMNGITVTGRVEDVRPWLAGAKLVVAPLLVARGIQNKVLEAMAMAKPIVASSGALTGVNAPEDAAIVADDPIAMAQAICELLADDDRRTHFGAAARKFVKTEFTWDAGLARFDHALDRLGLYSSSPKSSAAASAPVTN